MLRTSVSPNCQSDEANDVRALLCIEQVSRTRSEECTTSCFATVRAICAKHAFSGHNTPAQGVYFPDCCLASLFLFVVQGPHLRVTCEGLTTVRPITLGLSQVPLVAAKTYQPATCTSGATQRNGASRCPTLRHLLTTAQRGQHGHRLFPTCWSYRM
jgi:hypothetical protein